MRNIPDLECGKMGSLLGIREMPFNPGEMDIERKLFTLAMKKFGPNMDIALIVVITSLFCITSDIHCYT